MSSSRTSTLRLSTEHRLKTLLNYVRYLDLDKGIGGVNFSDKAGTKYTRRYLASAPDGVIAARYTAEGANKLHLVFRLIPGEELHADNATYSADGTGSFHGKLQTVYHNARIKVVPVGGTLRATDEGIEVMALLKCSSSSAVARASTASRQSALPATQRSWLTA